MFTSSVVNPAFAAMQPLLLLLLLGQPLFSCAMPPEWNLPSMPASWVLPSSSSHRCVPIPSSMELCSNIGYREMRLPNMLNHDTVNEVMEQTKHWIPLAKLACHRDIRVLLCSIYAPVCIPQILDRQIKPCRSLCDAVMRPCANVMRSFGYEWPEMLNCNQFPPETDLMCIQSTKATQADSNSTADCQACPEDVTYESIIGNFCVNQVAFKARIESIIKEPDGFRIRLKRRVRFFKSAGLTRQQKRNIRTVYIPKSSSGCICRSLEGAQTNLRKKVLMMGSLSSKSSSFTVSYLVEWQQQNRRFKQALRRIRGGGGKRARGRAGSGRRTGGSSPAASLCRLNQLTEQFPTALTSAPSRDGGSKGSGGNRRRRKNRRKKNKRKIKRKRKNKHRDRSTAAPGTVSGSAGDEVPIRMGSDGRLGRGTVASAAESVSRPRRQRRNRADGDRGRRNHAYDTF